MRRTKIVATLGPAVAREPALLGQLLEHGVNIARFTMSHGTQADHATMLSHLRKESEKLGIVVAAMADLRGPKIRTGLFKEGKIELKTGDTVTLTTRKVEGEGNLVPVDYAKFANMVHPGSKVFIGDGELEFEVEKVDGQEIKCVVIIGGEFGNSKGVNVQHATLDMPALAAKDLSDVEFAVKHDFDFIAQSYVRNSKDVLELRGLLEKLGSDAHIIAKIEEASGFRNLEEILTVADGLMVARGDLGVQLPLEDIPAVQKNIVASGRAASKPVIVATQMLDSMMRNPTPTRAEVSDVANGVVDGADALMLSGETARGQYPLRSVQMMNRIICKTEASLSNYNLMKDYDGGRKLTIAESIAKSVCYTARDLRANAIVTYTMQGHTARYIARYRPFTPLLAATSDKRELAKLQLVWGVHPVLVKKPKNTDDVFEKCVNEAEKKQLVGKGDLVIISAGLPFDVPGNTNFLKAHVV